MKQLYLSTFAMLLYISQSCVDAQFFNECLGVDIINQSGRIFYEGPENTFQACNWTFVWPETYLEQVVFVLLLIVFNPDEGQNNAVILPDGFMIPDRVRVRDNYPCQIYVNSNETLNSFVQEEVNLLCPDADTEQFHLSTWPPQITTESDDKLNFAFMFFILPTDSTPDEQNDNRCSQTVVPTIVLAILLVLALIAVAVLFFQIRRDKAAGISNEPSTSNSSENHRNQATDDGSCNNAYAEIAVTNGTAHRSQPAPAVENVKKTTMVDNELYKAYY